MRTEVAAARRERNFLLVLAGAIVVTRLPLVFLGYGSDGDAWRVAWRGVQLWHEGTYTPSRFPAFPLHEFINAPLAALGGSLATNIGALVFFLLSVVLFRRLLFRLKIPSVDLLSVTYAFFPLLWKNSAQSMDYSLGILFVLAAFMLYLDGSYVGGALLLGLATATRLSNLLFLIPMLFLPASDSRRKIAPIMLPVTLGTALLFYLPALFWSELLWNIPAMLLERIAMPFDMRLAMFGYRSIYAIGLIGTGAVIVTLFFLRHKIVFNSGKPELRFAALSAVLFGVFFFIVPDSREYLLPVIPFLLVAIGILLPQRYLGIVCACFLSYGFVNFDVVTHGISGNQFSPRITEGLVVRDFRIRRSLLEWRTSVAAFPLEDSTICLTGTGPALWFENPQLQHVADARELFGTDEAASSRIHPHLYFLEDLSPDEIASWQQRGFEIVALSGVHTTSEAHVPPLRVLDLPVPR